MGTLHAFHGLKNNICGGTSSNNINFSGMADISCAYFDHGADIRQRNSVLENVIFISVLACTTDNAKPIS